MAFLKTEGVDAWKAVDTEAGYGGYDGYPGRYYRGQGLRGPLYWLAGIVTAGVAERFLRDGVLLGNRGGYDGRGRGDGYGGNYHEHCDPVCRPVTHEVLHLTKEVLAEKDKVAKLEAERYAEANADKARSDAIRVTEHAMGEVERQLAYKQQQIDSLKEKVAELCCQGRLNEQADKFHEINDDCKFMRKTHINLADGIKPPERIVVEPHCRQVEEPHRVIVREERRGDDEGRETRFLANQVHELTEIVEALVKREHGRRDGDDGEGKGRKGKGE